MRSSAAQRGARRRRLGGGGSVATLTLVRAQRARAWAQARREEVVDAEQALGRAQLDLGALRVQARVGVERHVLRGARRGAARRARRTQRCSSIVRVGRVGRPACRGHARVRKRHGTTHGVSTRCVHARHSEMKLAGARGAGPAGRAARLEPAVLVPQERLRHPHAAPDALPARGASGGVGPAASAHRPAPARPPASQAWKSRAPCTPACRLRARPRARRRARRPARQPRRA